MSTMQQASIPRSSLGTYQVNSCYLIRGANQQGGAAVSDGLAAALAGT